MNTEIKSLELVDIKKLMQMYEKQPHYPDLLTRVFKEVWRERQNKLKDRGIECQVKVPSCLYTIEEIINLEGQGRRIGYLPQELDLKTLFSLTNSDQEIVDCFSEYKTSDKIKTGWFDYEASEETPNLNEPVFDKTSNSVMSLSQYIVAFLDHKLFTGQYLDSHSNTENHGPFVFLGGTFSSGMLNIYPVVKSTFDGKIIRTNQHPDVQFKSCKYVGHRRVSYPKVQA